MNAATLEAELLYGIPDTLRDLEASLLAAREETAQQAQSDAHEAVVASCEALQIVALGIAKAKGLSKQRCGGLVARLELKP